MKSKTGLIILFLTVMIIAAACSKEEQKSPASEKKPGFNIEPDGKAGAFLKQWNKNDLGEIFGQANLKDGSEWIEEGTVEVKTTKIVQGNDELTVYWEDESPGKIKLSGENSRWNVSGVKPGMTIAELEKLNGKPFRFYGFGWDNGGMVFDWGEGNLADKFRGVEVTIGFKDDIPEGKNTETDKMMGDNIKLNSDQEELKKYQLAVISVLVEFSCDNVKHEKPAESAE